jgi:hypothetical protein
MNIIIGANKEISNNYNRTLLNLLYTACSIDIQKKLKIHRCQ